MPLLSRAGKDDPQSTSDIPLWMLYPLFFVAIYLSHYRLLRLPYFWDEAGYYIPAAWDFFRLGQPNPSNHHHQRPPAAALHPTGRLVAPLGIRR